MRMYVINIEVFVEFMGFIDGVFCFPADCADIRKSFFVLH